MLDEVASVRDATALGVALQVDAPADERERHLLAALVAEPLPQLRTSIRAGLALVSPDPAAPWLQRALDLDGSAQGACRVLALAAARGRPPRLSAVTRALSDAAGHTESSRVECLWALARTPAAALSAESRETLHSLARAAGDAAEPDLQELALRLDAILGQVDEPLVRRVVAAGPLRPAIAAAELLARPTRISLLLELIREQRALLGGDAAQLYSWRVPWMLHAIHLAEGFADAPEVRALAEELLEAFAPEAPNPVPRAHIHCAAARLADRGRHWPGRVESCGGPEMDPSLRAIAAAQILGATPGSDELRAAYLGRIYERGPAEARAAVLQAVPSLAGEHAGPLLERGLGDGPALATPALQAIARGAPASADSTRAAVAKALGATPAPRLALAWLGAARALGLRTERGRLTRLATDPNVTVRQAALALIREWGWHAPPPAVPTRPVRDALPADRFPEPGAHFDVLLDTTAGPIRLSLDLDAAPATSVRFMEFVRAGHYDGRRFDSTATGALVSVAPRIEDTEVTLRSELGPTRFELGTVGMADDGRDTATGQFFVALGRQPELDYRFTAFGRVTEGVERLQLLHPGHRIREARVLVSRATAP